MPEKFIASSSIPIRIGDINYGNHVGNDAFVSLVHEARMQWLTANAMTELSIAGTGLIMAGLSLEFKSEAVYGDIIKIELAVGEISSLRFDLYYRLSTTRNNCTIQLANALTIMVSFDYKISKPVPIPGILLELLEST